MSATQLTDVLYGHANASERYKLALELRTLYSGISKEKVHATLYFMWECLLTML